MATSKNNKPSFADFVASKKGLQQSSQFLRIDCLASGSTYRCYTEDGEPKLVGIPWSIAKDLMRYELWFTFHRNEDGEFVVDDYKE